jgi:hypothetical protein
MSFSSSFSSFMSTPATTCATDVIEQSSFRRFITPEEDAEGSEAVTMNKVCLLFEEAENKPIEIPSLVDVVFDFCKMR